jgi:hypothetical protein
MALKTGPLYAYLKELRDGKLPVDITRIEQFGLPTGVSLGSMSEEADAEEFLAILRRCLDKLGVSDKILVECYLFTKGGADDCAKAAHRALDAQDVSNSETYYKNHLRSALERYADVLGAELVTLKSTTGHNRFSPPITPDWFEVLEITWSLRLDEKDYRRQYWRRRLDLRSLTADQPIVMLPNYWSGKGHREGDVVMLSGPEDKDDPHSHQCLRVRPEKAIALTWQLYIFDLGAPLLPGQRTTLEYTETLFDEDDCFCTYMLQYAARHPALEKITFETDIPPSLGISVVEAYREVPTHELAERYAPVKPITSVRRNEDGIFRHEVTDIRYPSRYAFRWKADYRQR